MNQQSSEHCWDLICGSGCTGFDVKTVQELHLVTLLFVLACFVVASCCFDVISLYVCLYV